VAAQARGVRTRARIIRATAEIINERSYNKAAVADIAARAQVTTGAVYFHFESKEAAAHTLIGLQNAHSRSRAQRIAATTDCPVQIMLRVSAALIADIIHDPVVRAGIRLTTEIHILSSPPLASWADWTDFNLTHLEAGVRVGRLRSDLDCSSTAEVIAAQIAGICILSVLWGDIPELARRGRTVWEQFLRANATSPQLLLEQLPEIFNVASTDQVSTPGSWLTDPRAWSRVSMA
jgi:AcrR family transcriptional regulator